MIATGHQPTDYLEGAAAIAGYLRERLGDTWTERRVRDARERGWLPIRSKKGIGLYAFGSELMAELCAPDTLTRPKTDA